MIKLLYKTLLLFFLPCCAFGCSILNDPWKLDFNDIVDKSNEILLIRVIEYQNSFYKFEIINEIKINKSRKHLQLIEASKIKSDEFIYSRSTDCSWQVNLLSKSLYVYFPDFYKKHPQALIPVTSDKDVIIRDIRNRVLNK